MNLFTQFFNKATKKQEKPTIALVLASGGARGMAHVGVIQELEKRGYQISSVAGCSMGAVVGGVYAAGKLEPFTKWMCNMEKADIFKLLDFTLNGQGFIKGDKVFNELKKIVGEINIEDLKVPYAAVAADLIRKEEIVFTKGNLYNAMRASVAIPSLLTPVIIEGREIVDGGVLNPIPIQHARRQQGDILVVVDINAKKGAKLKEPDLEKEKAHVERYKNKMVEFSNRFFDIFPKKEQNSEKRMGLFDLLLRSFDLSQDTLTEMLIEKYKPEVVVSISRDACATFEFYRAEEMIALGRETLAQLLDDKTQA
jgi:NTE family protein